MKAISIFFYFFAHYKIGAFFLLILIGIAIDFWRRKPFYTLIGFILGITNAFTGQFANAWFLAEFGKTSTAIITSSEQTNITSNYQYIWNYTVLIRTVDGKDIHTCFSNTNVSLYPISNSINIPPENEEFIVKYIPGFEKNIVILSNESAYGKRALINENLKQVFKAKTQFNANPNNNIFKHEYLQAMQNFIANPENATDTSNLHQFNETIKFLNK